MNPKGSRAEPFPWADALGFGFGILRLSPDAFWSMTPRELAAAFHGLTGRRRTEAMSRDALRSLLACFPDQEN